MKRWLVATFLCLSASLAGCVSSDLPDLRVGAVYEGSLLLTHSNSGTAIALPEGRWTLVSLGKTRGTNLNTPILNGYLVALDGKTMKGFISFSASTESSGGGWSVPNLCSRKDLHYRQPADTRENRGGGEINCWGIDHVGMTLSAKASQQARDAHQWATKNTTGMPRVALKVEYYRASGPKFLHVAYYFNPEADGFSPPVDAAWRSSDWHRDRLHTDPRKIEYIEKLKTWGTDWHRKVESGFHNRPF